MPDTETEDRAVAAAIALLTAPDPCRTTAAAIAQSVGLDAEDLERLFWRRTGVRLDRFIACLPLTDARALMARSRQRMAAPATPAAPPLAITVWAPDRSQAAPVIRWGRHPSPFGPVLAAAGETGMCRLGFDGDAAEPVRLAAEWPEARLIEDAGATRAAVARAFAPPDPNAEPTPLPVLLRGTPFQRRVWQALTAIPPGAIVSYRDVAAAVGQPKAARAVGGAVGANPIAVLIPCHRVLLTSGALHHYGWGPARKRALLAWERAADGDHRAPP